MKQKAEGAERLHQELEPRGNKSAKRLVLVSISPFAGMRHRCSPLPCFSALKYCICAAPPPRIQCIMTQLHQRLVVLMSKPKKPQGGDPPGFGNAPGAGPLLISLEVVLQRSFLLQHLPARPRHLLGRRASARLRMRQSQAARSHLQAPRWHHVPDPAEEMCLRPFWEDPWGAALNKRALQRKEMVWKEVLEPRLRGLTAGGDSCPGCRGGLDGSRAASPCRQPGVAAGAEPAAPERRRKAWPYPKHSDGCFQLS